MFVWTESLSPMSWTDPRSATSAKQEGIGVVVCGNMDSESETLRGDSPGGSANTARASGRGAPET